MWTERSRQVTKRPVLDVEKAFNLGNHFVPVYLHFWWGKVGATLVQFLSINQVKKPHQESKESTTSSTSTVENLSSLVVTSKQGYFFLYLVWNPQFHSLLIDGGFWSHLMFCGEVTFAHTFNFPSDFCSIKLPELVPMLHSLTTSQQIFSGCL